MKETYNYDFDEPCPIEIENKWLEGDTNNGWNN